MPRIAQNHKPGKEPIPNKKAKYEDAVTLYLDNIEDRDRALEFGAWLRANKMSPLAAKSGYNWYINFDGRHVCHIRLYDDTWHIWPREEVLQDILAREEIKDTLYDSIFYCIKCSHADGCKPVTDINVLGREIKGVCMYFYISLRNPDAEIIEILKEILLARKNLS